MSHEKFVRGKQIIPVQENREYEDPRSRSLLKVFKNNKEALDWRKMTVDKMVQYEIRMIRTFHIALDERGGPRSFVQRGNII